MTNERMSVSVEMSKLWTLTENMIDVMTMRHENEQQRSSA